ncbi:MAG: DUF5615 family PIN-like protein, partial [Deltaproteobacteria bacterium]|nr:DUF5615 family PIN-like protein [Deltaproteobacteria bacterium]
MRIFTDQDLWNVTLELLRQWGHDVLTTRDLGMEQASDETLLIEAKRRNRLLITRDKGFGSLVFISEIQSSGVILLRITSETAHEVQAEIGRVLNEHTDIELQRSF